MCVSVSGRGWFRLPTLMNQIFSMTCNLKTAFTRWVSVFGCITVLGFAPALLGDDRDGDDSDQAGEPQWNVRVDVLMVAMPQGKLLPLLPDLRDPKKIDRAVKRLLAAVQRKEAILTGYPTVTLLDGQRGVSETIAEKRYPTEFEVPQGSTTQGLTTQGTTVSPPAPETALISDSPLQTGFETRNAGVTLEVEPHVGSHGDSIQMTVTPQRVELLRYDPFEIGKTGSGKALNVEQPQFFTTKTTTDIVVKNGAHTLLGVHLLEKPEHYMEVFVLRAVATTIK